MPTGECGPYNASTSRPATIVGSANGRSITAFTADLPGKSSRTSIHAITVPKTALTSATIAETAIVSLSAATASGALTDDQNPWTPSLRDVQTSDAIGSATMTVRN